MFSGGLRKYCEDKLDSRMSLMDKQRTYAVGFTLPQISAAKHTVGLDFSVYRLKGFLFYFDISKLLKNGDTELSI